MTQKADLIHKMADMTTEEAIEILNIERGYFCDFKGCKEQQAFTMAIEALEQTRWIPVSERLPEEEEIVLITIDSSYYPKLYVDMGFYKVGTKKWYWFNKEDINPSIKVTGWMPLPKPYKAESEE